MPTMIRVRDLRQHVRCWWGQRVNRQAESPEKPWRVIRHLMPQGALSPSCLQTSPWHCLQWDTLLSCSTYTETQLLICTKGDKTDSELVFFHVNIRMWTCDIYTYTNGKLSIETLFKGIVHPKITLTLMSFHRNWNVPRPRNIVRTR